MPAASLSLKLRMKVPVWGVVWGGTGAVGVGQMVARGTGGLPEVEGAWVRVDGVVGPVLVFEVPEAT